MSADRRVPDKARKILAAKASDAVARKLSVFAGIALVFMALNFWSSATAVALGLSAAGCILLGFAISPDPDRYYLEGYTDGFDAGEAWAATYGPRADQAELRGVLDDRRELEPERADEPPGGAEQPDRGAGGATVVDLVDALGLARGEGPARPLTGYDGEPLPVDARPRRASFPFPPAGRSPRPARTITAARTSTRRANRDELSDR